MRVELIDRFSGELHGTLRLDERGVVVADEGAQWVIEQPLYVTWPGPDGELRWLTPYDDGEDYLRSVERELGRGTYHSAIFYPGEGDEGELRRVRVLPRPRRWPDLGKLPPQVARGVPGCGQVERGVLHEDRLLEFAQRLAWIEAELVDERRARVV